MNKETIFSAYNRTKKALNEAGIENYGGEARFIIRYVTGYDNAKILTNYNDELTPVQQTILNGIIAERITHYPLQYILGIWQFYSLDFFVGEGVLIPRSDTEILVDKCLDFLKDKKKARVLDLCAGSGCIAVCIAKNSDASLIAAEKYEKAYGYLLKNIKRHNADVTPILADIFDYETEEKFDLIVSNPPYISADEIDLMNKETEFEPKEALFSEDSTAFYEFISKNYKKNLKKGGMLAFEIGFLQGEKVKNFMIENGYENVTVLKDYDGNDRVVFGTVN